MVLDKFIEEYNIKVKEGGCMKVFVNFPKLDEDKEELENRVANFHATLLIEKINQLNINDESKKKILDLILKQVDACL